MKKYNLANLFLKEHGCLYKSLFWHLEKGFSIDLFLDDFPSVSRQRAEAVIEWSAKYFEQPKIIFDETTFG